MKTADGRVLTRNRRSLGLVEATTLTTKGWQPLDGEDPLAELDSLTSAPSVGSVEKVLDSEDKYKTAWRELDQDDDYDPSKDDSKLRRLENKLRETILVVRAVTGEVAPQGEGR